MSQPPTQLSPHFWVTQSRLYLTNNGVFVSEGQACLIDPCAFPNEIDAMARFLSEQPAEPRALVITHGHWDHILGPERFPGVPVIAQAGYVTETSRSARQIQREIAKWETSANIARKQPFTIPQPDVTFDSAMTLRMGSLSLQLTHAPGHAPDQSVIYCPDGAILWAADMLSDLEIPYVSDSLAAYERTLAMFAGWEIRILVPGHGHPTADGEEICSRVSEDIAYLAELRERVDQCLRQGKPVEETVAFCADMTYRHREENSACHRLNVESVYVELGGEGDPSKTGWSQWEYID